MMKGILFRPEMIKAIVEGRKTQTRRVIKPQLLDSYLPDSDLIKALKAIPEHTIKLRDKDDPNFIHIIPAPRYQPGETVYIKEAYAHFGNTYHQGDAFASVKYSDGSVEKHAFTGDPPKQKWWNTGKPVTYMQNPRTMPAWAARYFIKITDVRAERLQEITSDAAAAEGIRYTDGSYELEWMTPNAREKQRIEDFKTLWDTINKPPHDWQSNCWVWVYSFVKVDESNPPINQSSEGQG